MRTIGKLPSNVVLVVIAVLAPLVWPLTARATEYIVDTLADSSGDGNCSLRDAINAANGEPTAGSSCNTPATGGDEIDFGLSGSINLTQPLPPIKDSGLSINGPQTSPGITIDGQGVAQLFKVNARASLSLEFLTLTGGSSRAGGAIENLGTTSVSYCTLSGNKANDEGGAISNHGNLTLFNSTFSGNETISPRERLTLGGALFNDDNAVARITNITFSGNKADAGQGGFPTTPGAIYAKGKVYLKGTIFSGNQKTNCIQRHDHNLIDSGYNIADDASCNFVKGTNSAVVQSVGLDPNGLQNNGGATQTIALANGSPAIHAMPIVVCTDQSTPSKAIHFDQRGFARGVSGDTPSCDLGAFESGGVVPSTPQCSDAAASRPDLERNHRTQFVDETIVGVINPNGPYTINFTSASQDDPITSVIGRCENAFLHGFVAEVQQWSGVPEGRTYRLGFTATDNLTHGTCSGVVDVCISRKRELGRCVDNGRFYDSTVCPLNQ